MTSERLLESSDIDPRALVALLDFGAAEPCVCFFLYWSCPRDVQWFVKVRCPGCYEQKRVYLCEFHKMCLEKGIVGYDLACMEPAQLLEAQRVGIWV